MQGRACRPIVAALPTAALLLVLPWLDGGRSELGRLVLSALAGAAMLVGSVIMATKPPRPVFMAAGAAALLWFSLAWSGCPDQSLRALLMFSSGAMLLWVLSSQPGWAGRHCIYASLSLTVIACAASAVLETQLGQGVPDQWLDPSLRGRIAVRASGPFENPNLLGAFMSLSLPMLVGHSYALRRLPAALPAFAAGASVLAAGLTFSRAAWLGTAVGSLIIALAIARWPRRSHVRLVPAAIAALTLAVWQAPSVTARASTMPTMEQGTFAHRIFMWQAGLNMWRDRPWTGAGLGTYEARYAEARPKGVFRRYAVLTEPGSAHSDYIQWLAETGLVGVVLALGLGWAFVSWRRQLLHADRALAPAFSPLAAGAIGSLAAAAAGGLFQSDLRMPICLLVVCVAVDVLSASRRDAPDRVSHSSRVLAGMLAVAIAAAAAMAYLSDRSIGTGLVLAVGDRYADAEAALARAQRRNPLDARPHVILGDIASSRHLRGGRDVDLATAEAHYGRALVRDPFAGAIHAKLGDVFERQDRVEEALTSWDRACALDWYHASYHVQAGRLALRLGQRADAREHLDLALELFPLWLQLTEERQGLDSVTAQLLRAAEAESLSQR